MPDQLRVRVYNVRFGDAILVSVPDREGSESRMQHILIDVGNVLQGKGGDDSVFVPVIDDIVNVLNGAPLDLYVMTHEHLDHAQGLCYAASKCAPGELKTKLQVQHTWLTASADPQYYQSNARSSRKAAVYKHAERLSAHIHTLGRAALPFHWMLLNNDPRKTDECVEYIRNLAPAAKTHYVHRETPLAGKHPFERARLEIWAPEQDTSVYYGRSRGPSALTDSLVTLGPVPASRPSPPPGVDIGAYYDLLSAREAGVWDDLLAIDKASNNTSLVFALSWEQHTLLFAGDAELKSWRMMHNKGVLREVDFLKVSHHGSHNGTPDESLLDVFFPAGSAGQVRKAVISTWDETYGGIPHEPTNQKLRQRGELTTTLDDRSKLYVDFLFDAPE